MDKEKIKLDRMRYVKDSTPSNLAILAIVFNVFYLALIYTINNQYFYNFLIGVSVITNLLFMLLGFWCSIEVKNYHGKFGYLMIVLGIVEILRIFVYPMKAHGATTVIGEETIIVMNDGQFTKALIFLGVAACCMIVGGLLSIRDSRILQNHLNSIEKK